jgi:hypothetical protein
MTKPVMLGRAARARALVFGPLLGVVFGSGCTPEVTDGGGDDPGAPGAGGGSGGPTGTAGARPGPGPAGSGGSAGNVPAGGAGGGGPAGGASGGSGAADAGRATDAAGAPAAPVSFAGAQRAPQAPPLERPAPNIPVVWIEMTDKTRYPDPGTIGDSKKAGRVRIITEHDGNHGSPAAFATMPASLETAIGISLRGSSSRGFPQKSMSMELRDGMNMELKASVLGLPPEADYALVGCWTDKPCMRNPLAYWVGRGMGRWHPRVVFVELYFNGVYYGLYQFAESPRQDRNRVPLPKPAPDPAMGDVSGGYIFRKEAGGKGGIRDFQSPTPSPPVPGYAAEGVPPEKFAGLKAVYTFHYPRETDITPAQKSYLIGAVGKFEAMFAADDWASKYRDHVDITSFADFWIINELSNNVDGYFKSMYVAKDRDPAPGVLGKFYMTPFWDFNIAFGNADYRDGWRLDNWGWRLNRYGGECTTLPEPLPPACGGKCAFGKTCFNVPYVPFWYDRIISDAKFKDDVRCRWQALRATVIRTEAIDAQIDAWAAGLRPKAVDRHFNKWPTLKTKLWPNPCADTFRQTAFPNLLAPNCMPPTTPNLEYFNHQASWLKSWVKNRIEWLDKSIPGTCRM